MQVLSGLRMNWPSHNLRRAAAAEVLLRPCQNFTKSDVDLTGLRARTVSLKSNSRFSSSSMLNGSQKARHGIWEMRANVSLAFDCGMSTIGFQNQKVLRSIVHQWSLRQQRYMHTEGAGGDDEISSTPEEDAMIERHAALSEAIRASLTKLKREQAALERSAAQLGDLDAVREMGDLIVANMASAKNIFSKARSQQAATVVLSADKYLDDGSIVKVDIKLNTAKYANVNDQVGAIFKKVRRMERGVEVVEERLLLSMEKQDLVEALAEKVDAWDSNILAELEGLEALATKNPHISWPPPQSKKQVKTGLRAKKFRRYPGFEEGVQIWVGRNRKENEELTLRIGRPGEIWMHARGSPGSHVVVRTLGPIKTPSRETLQRAADLTALYSKLKAEVKVPITLADPRHIRKAPRTPVGTVMLMEEIGTMIGIPDRVHDLEEVTQEVEPSNETSST